MSTALISGPRLSLHHFQPGDAAGFYSLNADPEVLRYTGDTPFANVAEAEAFLRRYDHYCHHGFGRWSLYLGDEYAGFCGLRRTDLGVDLGFRLFRSLWGQGLATEAAQLALKLGYERYDLENIIGRAQRDNAASHRVLVKLGFELSGTLTEQGKPWLAYRLSRQSWLASSGCLA